MDLWGIVIGTIIVAGLGMGGSYLVWLKLQRKKHFWNARVYRLGDAIRVLRDRDGKIVNKIKLKQLIPYRTDKVLREENKKGTYYRLAGIDVPVNEVTGPCEEEWGDKSKWVSVLVEGEQGSILKPGYDRDGNKVFQPTPIDELNLIMQQSTMRKDRHAQQRDILQALVPYVVAGISMLALLGIVYFMVNGQIEMNENSNQAGIMMSENFAEAAENMKAGMNAMAGIEVKGEQVEIPDLGQQ